MLATIASDLLNNRSVYKYGCLKTERMAIAHVLLHLRPRLCHSFSFLHARI